MSDPAVDAVERVWTKRNHVKNRPRFHMEAAAREALRPIRDLLDKLALDTEPPCEFTKRISLEETAISELSALVYTSEELA